MSRGRLFFGNGAISAAVLGDMAPDVRAEVQAIVVDDEFLSKKEVFGIEQVPLSNLLEIFPPDENDFFVAIGYQELNDLRKQKVLQLAELGYRLFNIENAGRNVEYVLPETGGCFVAENALLQHNCDLGESSFVWPGSIVGHDSSIGSYCWISSGAIVGGNATIKDSTFVGMGAVVAHETVVGENCIIGANSFVSGIVPSGTVILPSRPSVHPLSSEDFLKLFDI